MNDERRVLIELCKKYAFDYPGIDGTPEEEVTISAWELRWALEAVIEGTNSANTGLHKIISCLIERLGMTIDELMELDREVNGR